MKCPICGDTLTPSKKNPDYMLCHSCRKKFRLPKKHTTAPVKTTPVRTEPVSSDEDNDDDDIYFVTNAYNESTTNISINQLYIYFYEYLVNGSVTSMSSNLRNAISAMASSVISRYTNSTFQTWLELNEFGTVTFTNNDKLSFTYDDYINSLKTTIDGYDEVTTFKGWFDKEWK